MSQYLFANGVAELDCAATLALLAGDVSHWVQFRVSDVKVPSDGLTLTPITEDRFVLTAKGDLRNIGRFLEPGLVAASAIGRVRGALELVCTDGGHSRSVLTLDDTGCRYGSSDCLNVPLALGEAVMQALAPGFTYLSSGPLGKTIVASGGDYGCACAGWVRDEPFCGHPVGPEGELRSLTDWWPDLDSCPGDTAFELVTSLISAPALEDPALVGVGSAIDNIEDRVIRRGLLDEWANRFPLPQEPVAVRWHAFCFDAPTFQFAPVICYQSSGAYIFEPDANGQAPGEAVRTAEIARTLRDDGMDPLTAIECAGAISR